MEESLRQAKAEGAVPTAHAFVVGHYEYDAQRLDDYDYDIGHVCHRESRVRTVEEAGAALLDWGFDPSRLTSYHLTDAP